MNKLIRAGFKRMFRIKTIYIYFVVLFFADGFDMIKEYFFSEPGENIPDPDGYLISSFMVMVLLSAVFITSFLGSEHEYGTIRNKLAVGHDRIKVFVSSFVVVYSMVMMMYAFVWVMTAVLGTLLLGGFLFTTQELIAVIVISFLGFTVLTAFFVLTAMCIHSRSVGAVTAVIAAFLTLIIGVMTVQLLSEPEYVPVEELSVQEAAQYESTQDGSLLVKNPDYLGGSQRKVYVIFHELCPVSQMLSYSDGLDAKKVLIPLAEMMVFMTAGALIFKKRDLK